MRATAKTVLVWLALFFAATACSAPTAGAKEAELMDYPQLLGAIAARKGEVVVVNFWATWCQPCRQEIPHLMRLREEFGEKDLYMLGVSLDQSESALERYMASAGFNYPIVLGTQDVISGFRVTAVPRTVVYDKTGLRVFSREGLVDFDQLHDLVQSLIDK